MRLTTTGIDPYAEVEMRRGRLTVVWVKKAPWEFRRLVKVGNESWAVAIGPFDIAWVPA
jgi:hypothetical protein